ncbi:unnamed protein product [Victoria cruziana]
MYSFLEDPLRKFRLLLISTYFDIKEGRVTGRRSSMVSTVATVKKKDSNSLFLLLLFLFFLIDSVFAVNESAIPVKVGLILDMNSVVGAVSSSCISMALDEFYADRVHTKRLVLHTRDVHGDILDAASAAIDLLNNVQVEAIIGPQKSGEAEIVASFGNRAQVPVLSFTATSPMVPSSKTPYFIRTVPDDSSQVHAIAAIFEAYGWKEVALVIEESDYGYGLLPFMIDSSQKMNIFVRCTTLIAPSHAEDFIRKELYKLMTMQTRVLVVHMDSSLGASFFRLVKEVGMLSKGYVWIVTNGIGNALSSMDHSDLQGLLALENYIPKSNAMDDFAIRWHHKILAERLELRPPELNAYGLWAYDTIQALALAIENTGVGMESGLQVDHSESSEQLFSLRVSLAGPKLLREISERNFRGLSGDFNLRNGKLQPAPPTAFQIVNIGDGGETEVGFWSPASGLSQSTAAVDPGLRPMIWPGGSTEVPRGWAVPTSERKMRIGVPVKDGFDEIIKIEVDPANNRTKASGYSIEVFEAALESLPYFLAHEFVHYGGHDKSNDWSYDDLIDQLYSMKLDAVLGDVTITPDRSDKVDFTLPYMASEVLMIVPVDEQNQAQWKKSAFLFFKPLTLELWLMSTAFFFLIAFVVWVLEHRDNPEFRGSPSEQLGRVFYFSFSTLVFAHKERLTSNLARFVMIVWVFVVLILTSSYTASLTSMLTVRHSQPAVTDVHTLIRNGDFVGYQRGSFVSGLLKQLKVDESKLRPYSSYEEYKDALSKGSKNGGVAAIFDESPFAKAFLAKYCSGFTVVGPIYKTGGIAFAFPRGSNLVADVSRAMLNATDRYRMKTWLGNTEPCQDPGSEGNFTSVSLSSLWSLFFVTGMVSIGALIIHCFNYISEYIRHKPDVELSQENQFIFGSINENGVPFQATRSRVLEDCGENSRAEKKPLTETLSQCNSCFPASQITRMRTRSSIRQEPDPVSSLEPQLRRSTRITRSQRRIYSP